MTTTRRDAKATEIMRARIEDDLNEAEALRRYHEALDAGLSDYEAREEGWPA